MHQGSAGDAGRSHGGKPGLTSAVGKSSLSDDRAAGSDVYGRFERALGIMIEEHCDETPAGFITRNEQRR